MGKPTFDDWNSESSAEGSDDFGSEPNSFQIDEASDFQSSREGMELLNP